MTEKVRAFTAIDLPSEVVSALGNLTAALDAANLRGLRTVRPEAVHLTLKFLGSVPSGRLEAVASVLTEVSGAHRPFALEVGSVGAYPKMQSPRVLWVGLAGDLEPLLALQRGVEDSLARLGFAPEHRKFSPHLTVARVRDGTSKDERNRAAELLSSTETMSGLCVEVDAISLMQSTLRPDGAVYARIATLPLRTGRQSQAPET